MTSPRLLALILGGLFFSHAGCASDEGDSGASPPRRAASAGKAGQPDEGEGGEGGAAGEGQGGQQQGGQAQGGQGGQQQGGQQQGGQEQGGQAQGGQQQGPCGAGQVKAGDHQWTVQVGSQRTFFVHVPASYKPGTPTPVVLNFHGRLSNAAQQILLTGMNGKADSAGFIAVHPEGEGGTWNTGLCCGSKADDVAFTRAMLDDIQSKLCIDPRRIHATGLSNGAFMAYQLACDLSDRIASVAPVAGSMEPLLLKGCSPVRPVSILHFHGTADLIVPYNGNAVQSVPAGIDEWAKRDKCPGQPTVAYKNGDVTCQTRAGCADNTEVMLCTIEGGGHQWPGGIAIPGLGNNTGNIKATDASWEFFSAHPMP